MAIRKVISRSIEDGAVASADITNATIVTADIADDAVTNAKIGANAVGTTEVADDAITGAKIENNPTIAGNATISGSLSAKGGAVFNEDSGDHDFRVESNNEANMLLLDAGNDRVVMSRSSSGATTFPLVLSNPPGNAANTAVGLRFVPTNATIGDRTCDIVGSQTTSGGNSMFMKFLISNGGSAVEHMRIHNTGTVSFNNGITLGNGISAAASNKLDDYEEGTFTPNFIGSGDNYNPTHTFRYGQYTKIGDTVYFTLRCASSSVTSNSDQVYISGLPFSANYGNSGISDAFPVVGNGMKIDFGVGYVYGNMTNTNSVITLLMQGYNVGSGSGIDNFRQHDMYASHDVRISGFYKTTA